MSIWGIKIEENDDAADFLSTIEEKPTFSNLKKPIEKVAKSKGYIEVDKGGEALAACALLPIIFGKNKSELIDQEALVKLRNNCAKEKNKELDKLINQADLILSKVTDKENSELAQLMSEKPMFFKTWKREVASLVKQLKNINTQNIKVQEVIKKKRQKYQVGDIVAIPLPKKQFAFGKVYNNFIVGVYDLISKRIEDVPTVLSHKIAFINAVTDAPIKSGAWPIIGHEPFPDKESAWGPPMASGIFPGMEYEPDEIRGTYKGKYYPIKPEEARGLQIHTISWNADLFVHEIIERIIKGKEADYRVR